jgi:hypothetical protein
MAYATEGMPVVLGTGNDGGFGNMNGLLPLILGGALFGGAGGFGGLFGNRGYGAGYGVGYPGGPGGYYAGNVEGGQTVGIASIQNQVANLSSKVDNMQLAGEIDELESSVSAGFANAATAGASGFADVQAALAGIGRDYNNLFGQVNQNVANANFTTLSSINGLGRDITASMNNQALQQLNSFNQLSSTIGSNFNATNTAMLQGFNEIGRDTATATNQLIAGQTALSSQLATCCCEIKSAVATDGQATRALINDVRMSELNAQLTDAKLQISNLQQTNTLNANNAAQTSVILQHIAPLLNNHHGH